MQLENLSGRVQNQSPDPKSAFEDGHQLDSVDQLELQFYETQLELYDTKFEILKNEEQLLVAQIETLRRQIKGPIILLDLIHMIQTDRSSAGPADRSGPGGFWLKLLTVSLFGCRAEGGGGLLRRV